METGKNFDVIIIGGSYAGLSAAMALGRSLRSVLVIDSDQACNRQTPYSHNFLTQDGVAPASIKEKAQQQVLAYPTVMLLQDLVTDGENLGNRFRITTLKNETFHAKRLIFATGLKDIMPEIPGVSECWGISVIHCPYCHGYEVKNQKTGIFANGDFAFHYAQLIANLTADLAIFTHGKSVLTPQQTHQIQNRNIPIIEKEITRIDHQHGKIQQLVFQDGSTYPLDALYTRPHFEQHCRLPEMLGCHLTEQGTLQVDMLQRTNVKHIFACGDNASPLRSVASAVAAGNFAGAAVNKEMVEEEF